MRKRGYRWIVSLAFALGMTACGQFGAGSSGNAEDAGTDVGVQAGNSGAAAGSSSTGTGTSTNAGGESTAVDLSAGFVMRLASEPNLCLASAASGAAYAAVTLTDCADSAGQVWRVAGTRVLDAGGNCLTLASSRVQAGVALRVQACAQNTNDPTEAWTAAGGTLCIASDASKCATISGQIEAGAQVILAASGDAAAQQFGFVAASGATSSDGNQASDVNSVELGTVTLALNLNTTDTSAIGGSKKSYSGPAIGFPNNPAKWDSWANYWQRASAQMPSTNTAAQTDWIRQAILKEAAATGMDARFILAVVMQESSGDVHVRTTNNGVNNPGLMQSHNGVSFSDTGDGGKASIFQMIKDGVEGTKDGDGILQGTVREKNYFAGGRWYNSGAIDASNLSNAMGATASYCSDLANRVMGRM